MTEILAHAVSRLSALPEHRQIEMAALLLSELDPDPVPEWHLEILREREVEMLTNPDEGMPWEEFVEELRQRFK